MANDPNSVATIKGTVVDPAGTGVPGIEVSCWYIHHDWPWEGPRTQTNSQGLYQFTIPTRFPYEIHTESPTCTYAQTDTFSVNPNETYQVEDLVVIPATNSCTGRITFQDGQPAANLSYGYISNNRSFYPTDEFNPPRTNSRGEFELEHLLPNELFSFWVFTDENTFCVWKRLDPNSQNLDLTITPSQCIELPPDWLMYGLHYAIARPMTYARDSRIQFSLPDLQGNIISLEDEQFRNKPVLVNICTSLCGGCRQEIPYLVNLKNQYQQDLEIIGIVFDYGTEEEQLEAVNSIAQEFDVNYPLLVGGAREQEVVANAIHGLELFSGYPTTIYIDRNGLVRHVQVGFFAVTEEYRQWQIQQVEQHIQSILNE